MCSLSTSGRAACGLHDLGSKWARSGLILRAIVCNVDCSPHIDVRLKDAVRAMPDVEGNVAGIWRDLGTVARSLNLPRPSYGSVLVLVHAERERRTEVRAARAAALEMLLDVELRGVPALPETIASTYRRNLARRRGSAR